MKPLITSGLCLFLGFALDVHAQSLTGVLSEEHGKPVPGATLVVRPVGRPVPSAPGGRGGPRLDAAPAVSVVSDRNGAFSIQSLSPGVYDVCAWGPTKYYVSECKRTPTPWLNLTSGKSSVISTPMLHTASNLRIYVRDTSGRVSYDTLAQKGVRENRLYFSVKYKSGAAVPAQAIAHSGQLLVFEVSIPTLEPVTLVVDSDLTVTDLLGNAIETNKISTRKIYSSGLSDMSISLVVN